MLGLRRSLEYVHLGGPQSGTHGPNKVSRSTRVPARNDTTHSPTVSRSTRVPDRYNTAHSPTVSRSTTVPTRNDTAHSATGTKDSGLG